MGLPSGLSTLFFGLESGVFNLIDAITNLWSIMTVFFNTTVIYQPLFMAMLLMITIFFMLYIVYDFLNFSNWGGKY